MKRELFVGNVGVGGRFPVSIQSMTKTATGDAQATLNQIRRLADAGCQIVRVSLPDRDSIVSFRRIVRYSPLPIIADIHFDGKLALAAIDANAHGLRINPGNIGSNALLKDILKQAAARSLPIRIGANSGSIPKKIASISRLSPAEKLVRSVQERIRYCEDQGFFHLKISLKSSSVPVTVNAYRLMDRCCDYPLHVGVTEAGFGCSGIVKSAVGIGALLLDGIGNTIRVSLTADPVEEVRAAKEILRAVELRREGIEIVSCPTCGRTRLDMQKKVHELQKKIHGLVVSRPMRVAVMGCEVNGPGEAAEADVGIAFSRNRAIVFVKGRQVARVEENRAIAELIARIEQNQLKKGKKT